MPEKEVTFEQLKEAVSDQFANGEYDFTIGSRVKPVPYGSRDVLVVPLEIGRGDKLVRKVIVAGYAKRDYVRRKARGEVTPPFDEIPQTLRDNVRKEVLERAPYLFSNDGTPRWLEGPVDIDFLAVIKQST